MNETQLILALFDKNLIKFGEFTLKSGELSYIYADIRAVISYPALFKDICDKFYKKIKSLDFNFICGVPYSALTFASGVAYANDIPMLLKRKEAKDYGLKKIIEGDFNSGDSCLIIEDVVTTGGSILDTIEVLKSYQLNIKDICILIDRNQGGKEHLQNLGYKVHNIINLLDIIEVLYQNKKINGEQKDKALACLTHSK